MSGAQAMIADWTTGTEAIAYQTCGTCKALWYFRRGFCPSCGAVEPFNHIASGEGVVHAISVVTRAATPEARAYVPYAIVMVDAKEGFRVMGHGDRELKIGDKVAVRFEKFIDRIVPYFARV